MPIILIVIAFLLIKNDFYYSSTSIEVVNQPKENPGTLYIPAIGISSVGNLVQIAFVDFRDATSHAAVAQIPANREAEKPEAFA
jgi:hypothetical protein